MVVMKYFLSAIVIVLFLSFSTSVLAKGPTTTPTPTPTVKSVCIDAGHGGSEVGTSNQDLLEKDVNLEVAVLLKEKLKTAGYVIYMTRDEGEDIDMSNADRYNYCNSKNASILVSIHHNGSTNPDADYSLGLYMKKSDVALAREVVNSVSSTLNLPNNGISRFASGVLLKSEMPSTISEGFFLTNSDEYNLVKSKVRQEQEADALLNAINNYFD
jgi:N-acetylmuramoyl-L-alanine amidase